VELLRGKTLAHCREKKEKKALENVFDRLEEEGDCGLTRMAGYKGKEKRGGRAAKKGKLEVKLDAFDVPK